MAGSVSAVTLFFFKEWNMHEWYLTLLQGQKVLPPSWPQEAGTFAWTLTEDVLCPSARFKTLLCVTDGPDEGEISCWDTTDVDNFKNSPSTRLLVNIQKRPLETAWIHSKIPVWNFWEIPKCQEMPPVTCKNNVLNKLLAVFLASHIAVPSITCALSKLKHP